MNFWKRGKRENKFGARRVEKAGLRFDSGLESAVHDLILLREKAGELELVKTQDRIKLTDAGIVYIADFQCRDLQTGETFWIEAKGFESERWKIIYKLWQFYGPGRLEIWKGTKARPVLTEVLRPMVAKNDQQKEDLKNELFTR